MILVVSHYSFRLHTANINAIRTILDGVAAAVLQIKEQAALSEAAKQKEKRLKRNKKAKARRAERKMEAMEEALNGDDF